MSKLILAISACLVVLVMACGKAPTPTLSPTATPTSRVTPGPSPKVTPTVAVNPVALFLEVLSPANESVVSPSPVEVKGRTVSDAVVSVNGQAVDVDANGNFAYRVTLEEGPNSIEVIASDFQGHQASKVVSVIYLK